MKYLFISIIIIQILCQVPTQNADSKIPEIVLQNPNNTQPNSIIDAVQQSIIKQINQQIHILLNQNKKTQHKQFQKQVQIQLQKKIQHIIQQNVQKITQLPIKLPVKQFFGFLGIQKLISKLFGIVISMFPFLVKLPVLKTIIKQKHTSSVRFVVIFGQILLNILMINFNMYKGNPIWRYGQHLVLLFFNSNILIFTFIYPNKNNQQSNFRWGAFSLIIISIILFLKSIPSVLKQLSPYIGLLAVANARYGQIKRVQVTKKIGYLQIKYIQLSAFGNILRMLSLAYQGVTDERPHLVNGVQFLLNIFLIYACKYKVAHSKVDKNLKKKSNSVEDDDKKEQKNEQQKKQEADKQNNTKQKKDQKQTKEGKQKKNK